MLPRHSGGRVVLDVSSKVERRRLEIVERVDGVCRYVETCLEYDEYAGSYWGVAYESGLYADPGLARADALQTMPWLRPPEEEEQVPEAMNRQRGPVASFPLP